MEQTLDRARRTASAFRWYWRELMGETKYAKYLAVHELDHPGCPPMTEREFWRARARQDDLDPPTRCC